MMWIAGAAAVIPGAIVLALALGYYLTYEPAPEIRILWRAGLTPARRAELERQFLLVNPNPFEDRLTYDLLDTSRKNLEALVNERDIHDTDNVDREGFTIPPQIPYGASWMWIGHRLPVLRTPGVVMRIVATSSFVLASIVAALFVSWRKASRPSGTAAPS